MAAIRSTVICGLSDKNSEFRTPAESGLSDEKRYESVRPLFAVCRIKIVNQRVKPHKEAVFRSTDFFSVCRIN